MSSNFNSSNNIYIPNLDSDDFLSQTENDLEELSIWEKAEFNSPMDYLKVSPNFEDQDISAMLSSSNMLVQQDFLSLANQYPLFTYPTNSAVIPAITQPIAINPPSHSAHYPPVFSAPPIVTVAIPGNSIDNNGNSSNNSDDDDNNKNNGSKNTSTNKKISSAKSLQSSANNNNNNIKLTDQSTDNDSESINPDNAAKLAAEEDKRRRNTAASARFRVKKKLREQVLERSAKEMALKVELYEEKIKELELENKWLRSLIVEKDARLLDVGPADKKRKLDDVVASDDHQNDKINNDNEMVGVEQDFKKIKN